MTSRDDQLDEWIIRDGLKKERRQRIVPASTDRLDAEDPGGGEAALETVAAWLSTETQIPLIELATLSRRAITLTLAEPAILPEPWVSEAGDSYEAHDCWGITLQHAAGLPRGDSYGWQVAGLTGLGTLADGSRGLLNTSRWEILGIAGTPEWTQNLMITQVMNQAVEPWSVDHDIWLIGYGEVAAKLVSFLATYHPVHRFHTADSLEGVTAADLKGTTATIYVMEAGLETEVRFRALQAPGVGMVTDEVVSDHAMFLSERDGGVAVLGPFSTNLEIYPNISPELITKMELAWDANGQAAFQQASGADFSELLDDEPLREPELSVETVNADFEAIVAEVEGAQTAPEEGQESKDVPTVADSPEDTASEPVDEGLQTAQVEDATDSAMGKGTAEPAGGEGHKEAEAPGPEGEDDPIEGTAPSVAVSSSADATAITSKVSMTLLGTVRARTEAGELTGRNAIALAILALSPDPVSPREISQSLWPDDEPEGHNARTRRTRLLKKLREHIGDIVSAGDEGWSVQQDQLTTDHDQILGIITNEPMEGDKTIIEACEQIAPPLADAGRWADGHRERMLDDLHRALADLKDRAIDADAFPVAKAAKVADTKLGEA